MRRFFPRCYTPNTTNQHVDVPPAPRGTLVGHPPTLDSTMTTNRPRHTRLFSLLLPILACFACDSADQADEDTADPTAFRMHVGVSEAGTFAVSASVSEGKLDLYICGEGESLSTHTRWFYGISVDAEGHFEHAVDGWKISGDVEGDFVTGTLTGDDDTAEPFRATFAEEGAVEGLYFGTGPECSATVIVYSDESGDTGRGACNDVTDSTIDQVIILTPLALTSQGIEVGVEVEGESELSTFFVEGQ